jgi:hypothetical protein
VASKTSPVKDLPPLQGTLRAGTNLDVLVLDHMSPGLELPKGQGVGLARKIGSDVLTSLIHGRFVNNPWIVHTDADALVPLEYFNKTPFLNQIESGVSAALVPFRHLPAGVLEDGVDRESVDRAIQSYDDYLHYYAQGLALAESPYAYYSIGSTIAVNVDAYTKVRGFPKKLAGEDFYLLNKVAKVGSVLPLDGAPIELIGRLSNRVPFGTGKANRKIYELYQNHQPYEVEAPQTFLVLRSFLRAAAGFLASGQESHFQSQFDQAPEIVTGLWQEYQQPLTDIWTGHGDTTAKLKSFHTWFDAFRTMKFVHLVRDRYFPNIDIDLALRESQKTKVSSNRSDR